MINLLRAGCIANDLLKEQDLRTSTPQRWRSEQLRAATMLVCPPLFGPGRCYQRGSSLAQAFQRPVKYQQWRRYRCGSAAHKRRSGALLRLPSIRPTIRRLARSITRYTQPFRFLRSTNVHISSSSSTGQHVRSPFFGRSRGSGGGAAAAFF